MLFFRRFCALAALATPLAAQAAPEKTMLTLSATGHARAKPTIMTAIFAMQDTGASPAEAQSLLNDRAARVSKLAKNAAHVAFSFQDYDTWQEEKKDGRKEWGARQKLVLTGQESHSQALLALTGKLQNDGLPLDALNWSLDAATRHRLEQEAQSQALTTIKSDAQHIAETVGMHVGAFHTINIGGRVSPPYVGVSMMRMAAPNMPQRSDDDAQEVTVQVTAEIYLTP
ncbi:SIMPL domain-containing protein [Candidatus Kirkpatrickella diaphorinae]|uniref:SIMPL domain-containing protein n=1 Tax=Candidatus Kirkpatrickella diaphorinae TaxID=2984322 RepID=A0ABY6GHX0_9PROT|nr:SIMPL domain-containing protein [Candidatus Kirkpatrickella diaphorinae]UYH51110.1 SIMPL domain-containing protein [Candidatus Kirkpatrickella diaphorinae]